MGSFDREHVGVERVGPCQPLAQVEAVGLNGGAGVTGKKPGKRPFDLVADRIGTLEQRDLTDRVRGGVGEHFDLPG